MRHETESVSLYALIQWGLQEHTERQLAALPSPQEVDAVLGDTSDFCRRVLEAVQQLDPDTAAGLLGLQNTAPQ